MCWIGTSTNGSAICGSRRTEREEHEDEEIMGTSLTCSATGRSKRRKKYIALSTTCGTGLFFFLFLFGREAA